MAPEFREDRVPVPWYAYQLDSIVFSLEILAMLSHWTGNG